MIKYVNVKKKVVKVIKNEFVNIFLILVFINLIGECVDWNSNCLSFLSRFRFWFNKIKFLCKINFKVYWMFKVYIKYVLN